MGSDHTGWFLGEKIGGIVIVDNAYCQPGSNEEGSPASRSLGGWRAGYEARMAGKRAQRAE